MQYQLNVITHNTQSVEPEAAYFQAVTQNALRALSFEGLGYDQAFAVAEYLDCVDGGSIKMDLPRYRQCVAVLGQYLFSAKRAEAKSLAAKSWAAQTIWSVLSEPMPTSEVPEHLALRAA